MIMSGAVTHEECIMRLKNGSCRISVAEMSKYRLITWVMHQCGRAKVVAPQDCADTIADFGEKIFRKHVDI